MDVLALYRQAQQTYDETLGEEERALKRGAYDDAAVINALSRRRREIVGLLMRTVLTAVADEIDATATWHEEDAKQRQDSSRHAYCVGMRMMAEDLRADLAVYDAEMRRRGLIP